MKLCEDNHDEVCFESRNCPVCEKEKEIEALEQKISDMREEVRELKFKAEIV